MSDEEVAKRLADEGVSEWLVQAVAALPRTSDDDELASLLVSVGDPLPIEGTRASCRTHFVIKDANNRPMVSALVRYLAGRVIDYCIPRSRVREALRYLQETGSAQKFSALDREARELFAVVERSGEGGELLLYALLEVVLKIPQILCKMPLKTSNQMHYHGTDGVHAKLLDSGTLALYWGESKLHQKVASAIDDCFESVAPYLVEDDDGDEPERRDLLLVRDNLDAGADEVTAALLQYFEGASAVTSKVEFRAACLVGFDYANYPSPFDDTGKAVRAEVVDAINGWAARVKSRIDDHELGDFEIEVFCVPIPSVEAFRTALRKKLAMAK